MFITKLKSFVSVVLLTSITTISYQSLVKAENVTLSEVVAFEDYLSMAAEMMNSKLPLLIDQDVRWDSTFAGPGKMLSYKYTLLNYSASQLEVHKFTQYMHKSITKTVCDDSATKIFPEEGVTLNFNVYDKSNNFITRIKLEPSDCGY